MTCNTCHYCEPAVMDGDGSLVLQCRRYPPQGLVDEDGVMQLWPQVESHDWCGEHEPKERPQ